ncbi:MAG: mRNA surveillance protein pelota [Candidatus Thermoplasmatota archaeon]
MRILHQDARSNEIKLMPQNIDDLWHLSNLIDERDMVFATTYRRKEEQSDKLRNERMEKVRMRLGIRVEKVEFHESDDRLRILGRIESGPQDIGEHHTLMVSPGEDITIIKPEWRTHHFDRIKRAVAAAEKPSLVFVSIEDTEAVVAAAREYGIKEHATITRNPGGKMYDAKSNEAEYLDEVVEKLRTVHRDEPLLVLGPGFVKEALAKRVREKLPEAARHMSVHSTGQAGMAGIHELMKKGVAGKLLDDTRVAHETRMVEELFTEIAKDGMFAYGEASVANAVAAGAVRVLLVLDTKVRSRAVEGMLRTVEGARGEFAIISSMHEAGRRLESLGGVAALLRYRME